MSSFNSRTAIHGNYLYRFGDTGEWQTCTLKQAENKIKQHTALLDIHRFTGKPALTILVNLRDEAAASRLKALFATPSRAQARAGIPLSDFMALDTAYDTARMRSASSSVKRARDHSRTMLTSEVTDLGRIHGLRFSGLSPTTIDIVSLEDLQSQGGKTEAPLVLHWGFRTESVPQVSRPLDKEGDIDHILKTLSDASTWKTEDPIIFRQGNLTEEEAFALSNSVNSARWRIDRPPTTGGVAFFEVESFLRPTAGKKPGPQLASKVAVWTADDVRAWASRFLTGDGDEESLALRIRRL